MPLGSYTVFKNIFVYATTDSLTWPKMALKTPDLLYPLHVCLIYIHCKLGVVLYYKV